MHEYFLVDPFDVDNGELGDASPALAFALGVDWCLFRQKLVSTPTPFSLGTLAANAERISRLCERHGRFAEWHEFSPGFVEFVVGGMMATSS